MKTDVTATLRENNFEPCSWIKPIVTENEKGESPEISDTDDSLINNLDDYINYMNLCDAERKFIDNHLKITKKVSKKIEKKNIQIVSNVRERKLRITTSNFGIINCCKELYPLPI